MIKVLKLKAMVWYVRVRCVSSPLSVVSPHMTFHKRFPFQVEYVMHYYGIPHCVCFGVGLGANVLARFARRRPTMVEGLVLINCSSQARKDSK